MGTGNNLPHDNLSLLIEEIRLLRAEQVTTNRGLRQLYKLLDTFAGVYLAAKFPYGKSTDRWGRRP